MIPLDRKFTSHVEHSSDERIRKIIKILAKGVIRLVRHRNKDGMIYKDELK